MDWLGYFWHPTLLLFMATGFLLVSLLWGSKRFDKKDHGFHAILIGSLATFLAAAVDYAEEVPWGVKTLTALFGTAQFEGRILPFLYFPGMVFFGIGVGRWMPKIWSVAAEIERRKAVEAELGGLLNEMRELAIRAEEAGRSKAEFLSTMGHELRTPLNAVIGFTELMQHDPQYSPQKHEEYLGIVANSGRQLLTIINDILDMSKLESGRMAVSVACFNLRDLIEDCVDFMQSRIEENELDVVLRCDDGDLRGDPRITRQIVLNLLSNAVKFTPDGGHVAIEATVGEQGCSISIADTGVGMDERELVAAMKPFVQVNQGLGRAYEGTGLGLPIVDRLCQLLKGKMTIGSTKGKGTTVVVRLDHLPVASHEAENDALITV